MWEDQMAQTLGERIRMLREMRKWQQEELAQKAGIGRETLSNIENNCRCVKAKELGNFADIFGVSTDQLLGRAAFDKINLETDSLKKRAGNAMRISVPAKSVQKFKEVLLYILNKVGARPNIGETVLYKLLYFIDFDFYEKYEEHLVGATYRKNTFGPTPVEFASIVSNMISKREIEKVKSSFYRKEQKKYLPLRAARLDVLSAKELQLIDGVLLRLGDKNAVQISEYSHGDVPWKVTEEMGIIDYETVFYRTTEYSVRNAEDE
jgi:transcriptional regulator with XRE-family HTH domain